MREGAAVGEPATPVANRLDDQRRDRATLVRMTAVVAAGYAFGASLQSTYVYARVPDEWRDVSLASRLGANGLSVVVLVALLAVLGVHRRGALAPVAGLVCAAGAATAALRIALQILFGVYPQPDVQVVQVELFAGFLITVISGFIGLWAVRSQQSYRERTRSAERAAVQVELAIKALEQEEIRVRREVAEGLHGTLQQKLVLVQARLDAVIAGATVGGMADEGLAALRWVRDELDHARQIDVRAMSRLLYPDRLELGLVPALRALLGQIPATIATQLVVSPQVRERDDPSSSRLTVSERLLAVRVVEEGVTNALKNGPAASIQVELDLDGEVLLVSVVNDGTPYEAGSSGAASGTGRLRQRLALVGGTLELRQGPGGRGARLAARLPLSGEGTPTPVAVDG